jgi:hypothetical protein
MADIPSTPADGNVKVAWVPTIASTTAPKVSELTGASAIDLSCYLSADGFTPSLDEAVISDDRLCDTETFEQPGRATRSLQVTYIDNSNTTDDNDAYETLTPGATGYIVVRRGKPYDTTFATADKVDVWPVKCGKQSDLPPEANSVLKVTQKLFVTGRVIDRVTVATS